MNAQFKKGVLELIVLESVRKRDMYGYELVAEVSKVVDVNEGTIYPLLKRLTNEHYFETYLRESTEGPVPQILPSDSCGDFIPGRSGDRVGPVSTAGQSFSKGAESMKNKESFLKELQNGLAVLAESEQQDILAEYAQHIDMRIAGGLTEEEAIQDFGDIHQLTAEILAAYHVNPAYSRAPGKLLDPRPALSRAWSHTGNFFRRLGHGLAVFFSRAGRRLPLFPTALQRGSASSSGGQTSCNKKVRNVLCRSPKNPAPYLAEAASRYGFRRVFPQCRKRYRPPVPFFGLAAVELRTGTVRAPLLGAALPHCFLFAC